MSSPIYQWTEAFDEYVRRRKERWATMTEDEVREEARAWLIQVGTHCYEDGEFVVAPRYRGEES